MTRSTEPKKQRFPKRERREEHLKFQLTPRDLEILNALGRYRFLRTGQIARLVFSENKTVQSARRRLKYLFHAGLVGRSQPLDALGEGAGEMAYFLEKRGYAFLEEDGLPQFSALNGVKSLFLRHSLEVSEFRLRWELATRRHDDIEIHRALMDAELKEHTLGLIGKKRYRLYDEMVDPIGRRKLVVHPDLLIILKANLSEERQFKRLFLVEIDRGTEGLRAIADKLTGYHLYKRESIYKKFGDFTDFRILIQTNSERRVENIGSLAEKFADTLDIWVTAGGEAEQDPLKQSIWRVAGKKDFQSILK